MPTLLEKNKVEIQPWYKLPEKKMATDGRAIDFIMKMIEDRLTIRGDPPKIKPKGPGDKVLIVRAKTGSGKSTIMPTFIYDTFYEKTHKGILVTQPTRATTTEIPYDIVKWNKHIVLGNNIGYQTGMAARKSAKGILFCTIGILLQFLKTLTDEQIVAKYGFIIIDEVHQRSIDLDMTLFYIKKLLGRVWNEKVCPLVILTSGTFEPKVYMDYFECPKENFVDVAGFSYPITDHFSEYDVSNYTSYVMNLVKQINTNEVKGDDDVLIFVQGSMQVKELVNLLNVYNYELFLNSSKKVNVKDKKSTNKKNTNKKDTNKNTNKQDETKNTNKEDENGLHTNYILPITLMSENISKGSYEYVALFSPIDTLKTTIYEYKNGEQGKELLEIQPTRRIMIGTNAVETGITLNSLKYVIDVGYVKDVQYNPQFNCTVISDKNVSKANSMQRRGRIGRNSPGDFYACYTKDTFDIFDPLPFPEIIKENVTMFLLATIIQITDTTLEELHKKSDKAFQKNQFDQNWFELQHKNAFDIKKLDILQPPSAESLCSSIEQLHGLGLITHEYLPTLFGYYASKFRKVKLENIRMILAAYHHGANVMDIVTIVAFLQVSLGIKKHKYKPRNPLKLTEQQANYYYKNIIQDEFIEYLFMWNEYMDIFDIKNNTYKNIITRIDAYCNDIGIKVDTIMQISELRDEILLDMSTMGLNPYYNGLGLDHSYNLVSIMRNNLQEGLNEITKIKNCIYEGYRFNLAILNDINKKYIGRFQNSLAVTSLFITKEEQPQKIIVSDVTLRKGMMGYEFSTGSVSVMDSYVDVDIEFLNH